MLYNAKDKQNVSARSGDAANSGKGFEAMGDYHDVALVGFSQSEYATFETFFRLVSSRRAKPFRASMKVAGASMVMLSTSDTAEIERTVALMATEQPLITVGTRRVASAWRHLERPINLNAVLMTVDTALGGTSAGAAPNVSTTMARPQSPAAAAPSAPSGLRAEPRLSQPPMDRIATPAMRDATSLPSMRPTMPPPSRPTAPPSLTTTPNNVTPISRVAAPVAIPTLPTEAIAAPPLLRAQPPSAPAPSAPVSRVNILVVDDSDVALKFIHGRLSAFGFNVDKCSSGEEALVRVSDGQYQFVFLDVMMEGLDGYQTCKAIKGRRYTSGKAPVVVMLTSRGGTIDKVRGTFAGCDAYLTKPLDETKMLKILLKHDPEIGNTISTLVNPSTIAMPPPTAQRSGASDPLAAAYASLDDKRR